MEQWIQGDVGGGWCWDVEWGLVDVSSQGKGGGDGCYELYQRSLVLR